MEVKQFLEIKLLVVKTTNLLKEKQMEKSPQIEIWYI